MFENMLVVAFGLSSFGPLLDMADNRLAMTLARA